jgi:hypothetical protein
MAGSVRETDTVNREYDWSNVAPSCAVIQAISDIKNVEPTSLSEELDTTLYDHVDPDALDRLVTTNTEISISFTVEKYQIHIDGNRLSVRVN